MSTSIAIPAGERGVIRVFALSMTDPEAKALRDDTDAQSTVLGAEVDPECVEIFPVSDLEEIGLPGYLAVGNGVPAEQLARDRRKLEQLGGWVLILFSKALRDRATTLVPNAALTLIGTYNEAQTDWSATQTLTSEAAKPRAAPSEPVKKRPSDAAMSGRIATVVLILLGLFTWAMIWIAG
jgi:hypothetical protein